MYVQETVYQERVLVLLLVGYGELLCKPSHLLLDECQVKHRCYFNCLLS